MATNDIIIKKLRECFEPMDEDSKGYNINHPFTNCALVFAYNGTGKTRLSYDFAHYLRNDGDPQHTLYYNAFTEDLFTWDNDLENNTARKLMINTGSALIQGLAGQNISDRLHRYLSVFTDIDFDFHYDKDNEEIPDYVVFSRNIKIRQKLNGVMQTIDDKVENIKISRGEERLFVWCFFRCIIDLVVGGNDAYKDIEYIYIDDPMSSLDDNNVIAFAQQLYSVIRQQHLQEVEAYKNGKCDFRRIRFVVSSHHALFFHIMVHGLNGDRRLRTFYLSRNRESDRPILKDIGDTGTPFYYNVAMMSEVKQAIDRKRLYTYHFTILRSVMEKIRDFFNHRDFATILEGITYRGETYDRTAFEQEELTDFYSRVVNVLTHQGDMFTPSLMNDDNRELATAIFNHLVQKYQFVLPDLGDFHSEKTISKDKETK